MSLLSWLLELLGQLAHAALGPVGELEHEGLLV